MKKFCLKTRDGRQQQTSLSVRSTKREKKKPRGAVSQTADKLNQCGILTFLQQRGSIPYKAAVC